MTSGIQIEHPAGRTLMEEEYFSQFGEDFLLWDFYEKKSNGFFLEIGAFDGIFLSPTYWFEQHGWKGICVEPHPDYFPMCRKNRPGSACVHAACVSNAELKSIEFYAEPSGLFSVLGAANEEMMRQRFVDAWGQDLTGVRRVDVPALTVDELLARYLPPGVNIDFVSIDVEGVEVDVLKGFDLEKYRPRVLIVETNSDSEREEVSSHLAVAGYREARRMYVNTLYVRTNEDEQKLQSILLEYKTARHPHPAGLAFTPPAQKIGEFRSERQAILQQWVAESRGQKSEIEMLTAALSSLREQLEGKEKEIESLKTVADERLSQMNQKEELIQSLAAQQLELARSQRGNRSLISKLLAILRGTGS